MGILDFFGGFGARKDNNYNSESYSDNEYDNEDNEYDNEDDEYGDEYDDECDEEYDDDYSDDVYYDGCRIYLTDEGYDWENYPRKGHEFWDTLESLMEDYDYDKAEDYLKNYFRKEEKNVFYYFAMAYFYSRKADSWHRSFEDIQRAKSHIDNASSNCDNDTKWYSLTERIKPYIYQNYYSMKEEMRIRKDLEKEWADLKYRIRYTNMDTYLPQLRKLAQNIRQQLSNGKFSGEFLGSVESDLKTWENTYCMAQAKKLIQDGNFDEAIKIASEIGDANSQAIIMTRATSAKLLEMITNGQLSQTDVNRQVLVVEDAMRRASALASDKDSIESLRNEVQNIVDMAKNYQNIEISSLFTEGPSKAISKSAPKVSSASDRESEYIEELRLCFEEGTITDKERRLLDRLRKSLGISEERTSELESMYKPQTLTAEEKEYADEVKACIEDGGEITSKERRLLDRLAKSLGIDSERSAQIEQMINKKN